MTTPGGSNNAMLLALLILLSAVSPFALNIIQPALPQLVSVFASDIQTVQLTLTVYLAGIALSQLLLGPLSDRLGRRPVLLGGLTLAVLASILGSFAHSIEWLIASRFAQSLGASVGVVLGRAIVRDLHGREKSSSMLGWITTATMVAPMLAPITGGYIAEHYNWHWTFGLVGILAFGTLIFAQLALPETNQPVAGASFLAVFSDAGGLLREPRFLGYAAVAAFSTATFFTYLGGATHVVITEMGLSPTAFGLWSMTTAVGYMSGNAIAGRFAMSFGSDRLILIGAVMGLVAAAASAVFDVIVGHHGPLGLFLPQMVIACANGLMLPCAFSGVVSVNPRAAGSASGLTGFFQMTVGALSAQLIGIVVAKNHSASAMVWAILAFTVLCLAAVPLIFRRERSL